jgi:hypothetical protein
MPGSRIPGTSITYVGGATGTNNTTNAVTTLGFSPSVGDLLVCGQCGFKTITGTGTPSVTDNATGGTNTWASSSPVTVSTTFKGAFSYSLVAFSASLTQVTAKWSTPGATTCVIYDFSGVASSSPLDTSASASGTSTGPLTAGNITPNESGAVVVNFGFAQITTLQSWSLGSGFGGLQDVASTSTNSAGEYVIQAGAGTQVTAAFGNNITSSAWIDWVAVFKPSSFSTPGGVGGPGLTGIGLRL